MPHLILEYTPNILEKKRFPELFKKCHEALAELLPTKITSCISRAFVSDDFYMGEGLVNDAFVHVTLKVLTGRSSETLEKTGNCIKAILKEYFKESADILHLQISLEMVELSKLY